MAVRVLADKMHSYRSGRPDRADSRACAENSLDAGFVEIQRAVTTIFLSAGRTGAGTGWRAGGLQGERAVKVRVDPGRCEGHSRCHSLAPELFELDDFGNATAVGDGSVPPGMEDRARLAAANCPEHAVEIVGDTG